MSSLVKVIRVRTIPPMPPIPILPILILNRYRFRYRYRKWRTWYRTGRHWKAEYAICKWLFRSILILSLLLSICRCFSQQQASVRSWQWAAADTSWRVEQGPGRCDIGRVGWRNKHVRSSKTHPLVNHCL